jgi:hypothetical protein
MSKAAVVVALIQDKTLQAEQEQHFKVVTAATVLVQVKLLLLAAAVVRVWLALPHLMQLRAVTAETELRQILRVQV